MLKKEKVSIYTAKVEANKTHKSIMGSLNKLQKIALEYYEGKENPSFRLMCDQLKLSKSDIQFKHVIDFGTVRELNNVEKQPDGTIKPTAKKTVFSFWLFESCLIRYANSKAIVTPKKATKKADKVTKVTKSKKTVKIEPKEAKKADKSEIKKVA